MFALLLFAFYPLAELKMDVLRERECKDSMERQLADERKLRGKLKSLYFFDRVRYCLKMSIRWKFVYMLNVKNDYQNWNSFKLI